MNRLMKIDPLPWWRTGGIPVGSCLMAQRYVRKIHAWDGMLNEAIPYPVNNPTSYQAPYNYNAYINNSQQSAPTCDPVKGIDLTTGIGVFNVDGIYVYPKVQGIPLRRGQSFLVSWHTASFVEGKGFIMRIVQAGGQGVNEHRIGLKFRRTGGGQSGPYVYYLDMYNGLTSQVRTWTGAAFPSSGIAIITPTGAFFNGAIVGAYSAAFGSWESTVSNALAGLWLGYYVNVNGTHDGSYSYMTFWLRHIAVWDCDISPYAQSLYQRLAA